MLHHPHSAIWVCVANGRHAEIYRWVRNRHYIPMAGNPHHRHFEERLEDELVPVEGTRLLAEKPTVYEYGNRIIGRVFESASPRRSAHEMRLPLYPRIAARHMARVASLLNEASNRAEFDQLVLAMPENLLPLLRQGLARQTMQKVIGEVPVNVASMTRSAILPHLIKADQDGVLG